MILLYAPNNDDVFLVRARQIASSLWPNEEIQTRNPFRLKLTDELEVNGVAGVILPYSFYGIGQRYRRQKIPVRYLRDPDPSTSQKRSLHGELSPLGFIPDELICAMLRLSTVKLKALLSVISNLAFLKKMLEKEQRHTSPRSEVLKLLILRIQSIEKGIES